MGGIVNTVNNAVDSVRKTVDSTPIGQKINSNKIGKEVLNNAQLTAMPGRNPAALGRIPLSNLNALKGDDQGQPGGAPPDMPEGEALNNRLQDQAATYRKNLPDIQRETGNIAAEGIRNDTSHGMKDITTGSNSRGLLYSGLRSGEQGALQTASASRLAKAQAAINHATSEQANAYDANALNQTYNSVNQGFSPEDVAYDAAIRQRQGSLEASKGLGQGLGLLAGNYFGQKSVPKQTNSNVTTSYAAPGYGG